MAGEETGAIVLTSKTLDDVLKGHPRVVVDCWAPWCRPCYRMDPIIENLSQHYSDQVVFGKLNVDENRTMALRYRVMSIPTLLFFEHGKLVNRLVGLLPIKALDQRISDWLKK